MATKHDFHKVIIGRAELLSFVELGVHNIPSKVDTGAYCSAIHATNITEKGGVLSFDLLAGLPFGDEAERHVETSQFALVNVENSFGHTEERYEVKLRVKLASKIFTSRFTLANRSKKTYPILLGRKLLNSRFLVDTSASGVDVLALKQKYDIILPQDPDDAVALPDGYITPQ